MIYVLAALFLLAVPGGYIDAYAARQRGDRVRARTTARMATQSLIGFVVIVPFYLASGGLALVVSVLLLALGFTAGVDYGRDYPRANPTHRDQAAV